jgi:peptidoglycan-N-acetylglucosamine deacetylase
MKKRLLMMLMGATLMTVLHADTFAWPEGKKAAVCLTYDDAWPSQLDIALPALDSMGFKATFYINGNAEFFDKRLDEWRQVAANGHELGNHTLFHPCLEFKNNERRAWLTDEYKMENYTLDQFLLECRVANVLLKAVDGRMERSFAYTCCDTLVGDHISLLQPLAAMFPGARGIGETPTSLSELNVMDLPSFAVLNHSGTQLIEQVKIAEQNGTLVVFLFHGIDESHLPVSSAAHQELLDYLHQNRKTIWTDTFLNVVKHLNSEHKRLSQP